MKQRVGLLSQSECLCSRRFKVAIITLLTLLAVPMVTVLSGQVAYAQCVADDGTVLYDNYDQNSSTCKLAISTHNQLKSTNNSSDSNSSSSSDNDDTCELPDGTKTSKSSLGEPCSTYVAALCQLDTYKNYDACNGVTTDDIKFNGAITTLNSRVCATTDSMEKCWNDNGWPTFSSDYSDCRINPTSSMGDSLSGSSITVQSYLSKSFYCKDKDSSDNRWWVCNFYNNNGNLGMSCPDATTRTATKNGLLSAENLSDDEFAKISQTDPAASAKNDSSDDSDSGSTEEDSCEAGLFGFGWIFCPGSNIVESYINGLTNWINDSLKWTVLSDANGEIISKWRTFLNLANIAFAIVFLIMIYSMATSTGLSNYDVKKILPKVIVCAVAVNISFYICAAMVDISNIVGQGLFSLLSGDDSTWYISGDGGTPISDLLTGGAELVLIIVALFIFGGTAAVALAVIYLAVMFRQIALVCLIVVSPLAFVCYMLPNTQKWFQKWMDLFIRLLMVYPMFTAVWGGARWVSVLMTSAQSGTTTVSNPAPVFMTNLVCMAAPAFAILPLFRMSGGIMSQISGGLQRGAAKTGVANKMNSAGRAAGKAAAAPARALGRWTGKKVGGAVGAGLANAGGKMVGQGGVKGALGTGLVNAGLGMAANSQKPSDTIRSKAEADAKALNSNLTSDELSTMATTGMLNGKEVDPIRWADAMNSTGANMSDDDVHAMLNNAEAKASQMKNKEEANRLRKSAAAAARTAKPSMISNAEIDAFERGEWANRVASAPADYTGGAYQYAYDMSVANTAAKMSYSDQSKLSGSKAKAINSSISNLRTAASSDTTSPEVRRSTMEAVSSASNKLSYNASGILADQKAWNGMDSDARAYNAMFANGQAGTSSEPAAEYQSLAQQQVAPLANSTAQAQQPAQQPAQQQQPVQQHQPVQPPTTPEP